MTIIFHDSVCFDIYYVGLIMSTDVAEYRQIRKHITAALRDFGVGKKSIESKVNKYILEGIPKGLYWSRCQSTRQKSSSFPLDL